MKKVLASLAIALISGCGAGGLSGLASVDLQEVVILLKPDSEAVITGTPRNGSAVEFAQTLTTPGITLLELSFPPEDSTGIQSLMEDSGFPVLFGFGEPGVAMHIEGLYWELRINPGALTTGTAMIINATGETWNAERVELSDGSIVIARSSGRVSIPPEGAVFPWWQMEASPPETLLVYGYPTHGKWNPLIALPMRSSPPPIPGTHGSTIRNDTLWIPADDLVRTELTWTRRSNGYNCMLQLHSNTDREVRYRIILPTRLPRGALAQPGEGFSNTITLPAGHSTTIRYSEIYPRGT